MEYFCRVRPRRPCVARGLSSRYPFGSWRAWARWRGTGRPGATRETVKNRGSHQPTGAAHRHAYPRSAGNAAALPRACDQSFAPPAAGALRPLPRFSTVACISMGAVSYLGPNVNIGHFPHVANACAMRALRTAAPCCCQGNAQPVPTPLRVSRPCMSSRCMIIRWHEWSSDRHGHCGSARASATIFSPDCSSSPIRASWRTYADSFMVRLHSGS